MENPYATSLPLLDEVKLQARVLVPVVRALRGRIGKEAADERSLVCDLDFDIAEVGAPDVELRPTQTIMQGAPYCDFRYRFRT